MSELEPAYDWEHSLRGPSMLRFGPMIGADFLDIAHHYEAHSLQDVVIDRAVEEIKSNHLRSDSYGLALYSLSVLELYVHNTTTRQISPSAPLISPSDPNFSKWLSDGDEKSIYFDYPQTLFNSFANIFTSTQYVLTMLEEEKMISVGDDLDKTAKTIKAPWFKELLFDMARAPQGFWEIPDPIKTNGSMYASQEKHQNRVRQALERRLSDNRPIFDTDENGQPFLSEKTKQIMAAHRKKARLIQDDGVTIIVDRKRNEESERDRVQTSWYRKTSSGCPVAHKKLGTKAIEDVFTDVQIEQLKAKGIIVEADEGYELFDFFDFAVNFVADHLEALNKKLKDSGVKRLLEDEARARATAAV